MRSGYQGSTQMKLHTRAGRASMLLEICMHALDAESLRVACYFMF